MWILVLFQVLVQVAMAEVKRIVVLEFHQSGMSPEVMFQLSDQSRMAIVKSLDHKQYSLMTRENMKVILSDMGKDVNCFEGTCEVDVARNVGADYVVSGTVAFIDEQFDITLKLHDSITGSIEAMETATVKTVSDLKVQSYNSTLDLLRLGLNEKVVAKKTLPSKNAEQSQLDRIREDAQKAQEDLQKASRVKAERTESKPPSTKSKSVSTKPASNTAVSTTTKAPSKPSVTASSSSSSPSSKAPPKKTTPKPTVPDQPAPVTKSSVYLERNAGVPSEIDRAFYKARLLPAGSYKRGCTLEQQKKCNPNENPVQSVTISRPFYVMDTEVTQELYQDVMNQNPSSHKGSRLPVETVSWFDAVAFANRLSEKEGLTPCYQILGEDVKWSNNSCNGWRLPTEAEWEYAARAFSDTKYSGGNSASSVALYYGNNNDTTESVRSRQPNRFGLYGMSGNVGEWCWDGLHPYGDTPVTDPSKRGHKYRVYRGGGFYSSKTKLRTSSREKEYSSTHNENIGFRLVRLP